MTDELRDIPGLEGRYAVTADGRVWSHAKTWWNHNAVKKHPGRWMTPVRDGRGYLVVRMPKGVTRLVHRLVALAWVPNPDPTSRTQVNHIDGNTLNPRASNLEWTTSSENHGHAFKALGRGKSDDQRAACARMGSATRRLTMEQAQELRARRSRGEAVKALAAAYGISHSAVENILKFRTYQP